MSWLYDVCFDFPLMRCQQAYPVEQQLVDPYAETDVRELPDNQLGLSPSITVPCPLLCSEMFRELT